MRTSATALSDCLRPKADIQQTVTRFAYLLAFFASVASAADLKQFASPGDDLQVTARKVSETPIVRGPPVVWVGKVLDVSVRRRDDGVTVLEWFCEQHPFRSAPKLPLVEPLLLKTEPAGHFVVTIQLPNLSVTEVQEKIVKPLKAPTWVVVRGEPVLVRAWKGTRAVFVHAIAAGFSDKLQVELPK